MPPATAGPSMAAITGLSSSSREGPSGPRGISPPLPRGRAVEISELAQRIIGIERADVFEVPARAKRAARAIEDSDASIPIGIELKKGGWQRIRAFGVHCVAGFGPVMNHGPYRSIFLNSDGHTGISSSRRRARQATGSRR